MAFQGKLSEQELKYRSSDDSMWLVPQPREYKNWMVWPRTILNNMDLSDCNDTINGVCLQDKTLEECISECKGDCGTGIYFKFATGKSICIPVRTGIHPTLNPVYRLRKQEYYNLLPQNVEVSVFVNKDKFSYPPGLGNSIFFYDFITIKNLENKSFIKIQNRKKNNFLYFSPENSNSTIQILPIITTGGKFQSNSPLLYGDKFNLIIPGTNLIAITSPNLENVLEWIIAPLNITKISQTYFTFLPTNSKSLGDVVDYQEPLILGYGDNTIYLSESGLLTINNRPELFGNTKFTILSKMVGYYCNQNSCEEIPIKDITKDGKYNNSIVYRHKGCWNRCKNHDTNLYREVNKKNTNITIIILLIGLIIVLLLLYKFFKR